MGTEATRLVEQTAFSAGVFGPKSGTAVLADDVKNGERALANRTRYHEDTRIIDCDVTGILAEVNDVVAQYQLHIANSGGAYHVPVDNVNTVGPFTPTTCVLVGGGDAANQDAITRANAVRTALLAHMANTGGTFHDFVDDVRGPLLTAVPAATEIQSLRTLLIALKAYLNAHEPGDDSGLNQIHPVNDVTNTVTAADPTIATMRGPVAITEYPDVQTFTANGTWTKPVGATWVHVYLVGGGGGGGAGARRALATDSSGGEGGSGGGVTDRWVDATVLGATEAVTIGAGGAGGAAETSDDNNGPSGSNASSTTFGALRAGGGKGGNGGVIAGSPVASVGGFGDILGGDGGAVTIGAAGSDAPTASGAAGGGGGGGIGASTATAGGAGGVSYGNFVTAAAGGAVSGGGGVNGTAATIDGPGHGGGGGASHAAGVGGSGGAGGTYGGGGGGGGSSANGNNSGAGGDGADGLAIIVSY